MRFPLSLAALLLSLGLSFLSWQAQGQDEEPSVSTSVATPPQAAGAPVVKDLAPPKLPKKVEFSAADIQKECKKYEGKFIGYYDRIYKIEKCKRREIVSSDDDQNPILTGKTVLNVDSPTVAKIPAGESIGNEKPSNKVNCLKFEGRYVLSRGDEVYFIEKCKKNLLPDWDTYVEHSQKRGKRGLEIFELTEAEFRGIAPGKEIKSVLDEEYKKLLDAEKDVDVIPLAEACKGMNGKFVTYYSRIYHIEACRKQPVDPELFLQRNPSYKLSEMTSEQWISIPTGKDYKIR